MMMVVGNSGHPGGIAKATLMTLIMGVLYRSAADSCSACGELRLCPIATLPQEFTPAMPPKADKPEPMRTTRSGISADEHASSHTNSTLLSHLPNS